MENTNWKREPYQGHKDWNHWNVALWVGNDEPLYRDALAALERTRKRYARRSQRLGLPALSPDELAHRAARCLYHELRDGGVRQTPDGAPYTIKALAAALEDLE